MIFCKPHQHQRPVFFFKPFEQFCNIVSRIDCRSCRSLCIGLRIDPFTAAWLFVSHAPRPRSPEHQARPNSHRMQPRRVARSPCKFSSLKKQPHKHFLRRIFRILHAAHQPPAHPPYPLSKPLHQGRERRPVRTLPCRLRRQLLVGEFHRHPRTCGSVSVQPHGVLQPATAGRQSMRCRSDRACHKKILIAGIIGILTVFARSAEINSGGRRGLELVLNPRSAPVAGARP